MSEVVIKQQMQEMGLQGMLKSFETDLTLAVKQDWGYEELISKLLQAERDHRNEESIRKKIKLANFKKGAYLEDFDFTTKRTITKIQVQDLMSLKWLESARPILLIGETGVGKSFLAEAIGRYACSKKRSVLFREATELFLMIADARRLNKYLTTRKRLAQFDILIIDDFGMRKINSTEAQDLKELLEIRSLSKSTIFTSQLPLNHWKEVIDDPIILEAIVDLLEHSSLKFEIKGESYRKTKAKKLDSKNLDH